MPSLLLLPLAAEESPGMLPYLVGGFALVALLAMLMSLLAFGKGRDHS
jgi:hypothetical protein